MSGERRKNQRYTCYLVAHPSGRNQEEVDCFGVVRNISMGGAMLETEEEVKLDWMLNLTFLNSDGIQIWEGTGRVVWMRTQESKKILGIQFNQPLEEGCLEDSERFIQPAT